jgi:hypothetical protein
MPLRGAGFVMTPIGVSEIGSWVVPRKRRQLAAWYRDFAERAGNPAIWEARLHMAQDLDAQAHRLEQRQAG